jgi:hypothetical protein
LRNDLFHGKTEAANFDNLYNGFSTARQLLLIYARCKRSKVKADAALKNLEQLESQLSAHREFNRNRIDALGIGVGSFRSGKRFILQLIFAMIWLFAGMSTRKIIHNLVKMWLPQACVWLEWLASG